MGTMGLTLKELLDTISSKEWGDLHGVSERRVRFLCEEEGRIPGARREGRNWRIPRTAPYPPDARYTEPND